MTNTIPITMSTVTNSYLGFVGLELLYTCIYIVVMYASYNILVIFLHSKFYKQRYENWWRKVISRYVSDIHEQKSWIQNRRSNLWYLENGYEEIEDIPFFLMNKSYFSSSDADNSYFSRVWNLTLIHQEKGNFLFITFFFCKTKFIKIWI